MNYFQDLLLSYSQLKKRQLKIVLEAQPIGSNQGARTSHPQDTNAPQDDRDPQAVQAANNAIKKGMLSNSKDQAQPVLCGSKNLKFWKSQSGKNKGMVHVDAGLLHQVTMIGDAGGNPVEGQAYSALINLFSGKDPATGGKRKDDPALDPIPSPLKDSGYSTALTETALEGYQKNAREAVRKQVGGDQFIGDGASYARGFAPQSLENKLSNAKTVAMTEDGPKEIPVDADLIQGAAQSAKFISDLGVQSEISEGDCKKVKSRIQKSGQKIIYLHANDPSQGVALTPSPMDKYFMSNVEKLCKSPITQVATSNFTQQKKNDFLGKSIESLASLNPLMDLTNDMPAGDAKNGLQEWQHKKLGEIFGGAVQLAQAAYAWAIAQKDSATDMPSHFKERFILRAGEIFTNPAMLQKILAQVNKMGQPIRRKYKPDMVLPIGLETGFGNKGDVAYVFMKKKGESNEDYAKRTSKVKVPLKTMTLGELHDITNENMRDAIPEYLKSMGLDPETVSENTVIQVCPVGMKTYFDFGAVKYGESDSMTNQRGFLQGNYKPEFLAQCVQEVGIPKNKVQSVLKYRQDVMKIDTLVRDLIPEGTKFVTQKNGKSELANPNDAVKLIHQKLKNNLDYGEMQHNELMNIITDDDGNMLDMNNDVTRSRVSEQISRLMISARLNQDMNSSDPEVRYKARAAEMVMMFGIGGEHGDGISDVRDVGRFQSFVVNHNDPLRNCIKGIMSEPPTWEIQSNAYGCSYYNPETKERVSISRIGATRDSGGRTTNTSVKVNRAAILLANQLTDKQSKLENDPGVTGDEMEAGMGEAIDAYLDGQKTFLTELIKVAHSNQSE